MIKISQVALTISLTGMCIAVESPSLNHLSGDLLYRVVKEVPQGENMQFRGSQYVSMSAPFYRKEAAKSLRLVSRPLAVIFSSETSPLVICLRNKPEKLRTILSNPSSYFPLRVTAEHELNLSGDHIKRLVEIQPNLYSLSFQRYHLALDLLAPLTNLQILQIFNYGSAKGKHSFLREYKVRFLGINPILESLNLLKSGELGAYLKGDRLYCKVKDKEEIEVSKNQENSVTPSNFGIPSNAFKLLKEFIEHTTNKSVEESRYLNYNEYYIDELFKFTECRGHTTFMSSVAYFTNLKKLEITNSALEKFPTLPSLSKLVELNVCDNNLTTVEPFSNLVKLDLLILNGNRNFRDLGPLTTLTALKVLGLASTAVDNLSPLSHLTSLTSINLERNYQIRELVPLSTLTSLRRLNLRSTKVKTLAPIISLYQLASLDLSNIMTISTFKTLSTLSNLESLDVDQAVIDSYSFLPHLVSLKEITIEEGGGSGRDGNYSFFSKAEETIGFRVKIIKHDEDYDY